MKYFSEWTTIPAINTSASEHYHFNVIIREINLGDINMNKELCFCGSGKSAADCHAEIADNTAMSYLFETFKLIEADIKNAVPTPQCRKNCSECCGYSFEVSAAECFAILRYIQKKFSGFYIAALKKNAIRKIPEFPAINDTANHVGEKFAPCLFLDNRRGCRIYEVRPLICRMYGYYAPAGYCPGVDSKIEFISVELDNHLSKFLGDTLTEDLRVKPPIAVPLVYWFGSNALKNAQVKRLFMLAHEKSIVDYIEFSIHADFNEWF